MQQLQTTVWSSHNFSFAPVSIFLKKHTDYALWHICVLLLWAISERLGKILKYHQGHSYCRIYLVSFLELTIAITRNPFKHVQHIKLSSIIFKLHFKLWSPPQVFVQTYLRLIGISIYCWQNYSSTKSPKNTSKLQNDNTKKEYAV